MAMAMALVGVVPMAAGGSEEVSAPASIYAVEFSGASADNVRCVWRHEFAQSAVSQPLRQSACCGTHAIERFDALVVAMHTCPRVPDDSFLISFSA
jgi:hypothetical protein